MHNACSDYDLNIYNGNVIYSSIFDVAIKCGGNIGREGGETELSIASQTIEDGDDYNKIKEENQKISSVCNDEVSKDDDGDK